MLCRHWSLLIRWRWSQFVARPSRLQPRQGDQGPLKQVSPLPILHTIYNHKQAFDYMCYFCGKRIYCIGRFIDISLSNLMFDEGFEYCFVRLNACSYMVMVTNRSKSNTNFHVFLCNCVRTCSKMLKQMSVWIKNEKEKKKKLPFI